MPDEKRQDLYMLDEIMKDLVRLRDTLEALASGQPMDDLQW